MATTINSCGSKWHGQTPDGIDALISVLDAYTLDPRLEGWNGFASVVGGRMWAFKGNFLEVSFVFNIETDEPLTIAKLRHAIHENLSSDAYKTLRAQLTEAKANNSGPSWRTSGMNEHPNSPWLPKTLVDE